MSKLQDNRTTPQFMAMLGKMGVFSYLEFTLSTDQIFISQNAVGNSTLFRFAASFISLFWSSLLSFEKYEKQSGNITSDLLRHTVFENHRKCLIKHCERSELRLDFEWTKGF